MCVLDVMDVCVWDVMPCLTFYFCQIRNDSYLLIRVHLFAEISSDLKVKCDEATRQYGNTFFGDCGRCTRP